MKGVVGLLCDIKHVFLIQPIEILNACVQEVNSHISFIYFMYFCLFSKWTIPLELLLPTVSLEMVFKVIDLPHGLTCFFSHNSQELQMESLMHPDFHSDKHVKAFQSDSSRFIHLDLKSIWAEQCVKFSSSFSQSPISFSGLRPKSFSSLFWLCLELEHSAFASVTQH